MVLELADHLHRAWDDTERKEVAVESKGVNAGASQKLSDRGLSGR